VTSLACEAAARAVGQAVEVSTAANWVGLSMGLDIVQEGAESSGVMLYRVVDFDCKHVVVGLLGSQDGHRCSGQRTDVHAGVGPGEDAAQGGRYHSQARVSPRGLTLAYQAAAMGYRAIEAVEVWVVHFAGEVGSIVGTEALRCHWRHQDGMLTEEAGAGWEPQRRRAVVARAVVVRCLVARLMTAVCFHLVALQD
jgi:hypothetical protein